MRFNDVYNTLQKFKIVNQAELGRVLGVSRANINYKKQANVLLSDEDVKKVETYYNLKLTDNNKSSNNISFTGSYKPLSDIIQIPYWSGLPDELKHPEYVSVLAQRISIVHAWELKPENLCIVPMVGDKMVNYWYKINDGDILIIDTSRNHISGNGVYFATSQNNTRFWIREMQVLVNGDVEFKGFAPSGNTVRVVSKEDLEKVGFQIVGKVIKNVSFRL